MIQWVYETTRKSKASKTVVATDDKRIHECVIQFGGHSIMTSPAHATGTDRVAEAVQGMEADLILNVQGDEPLLPTAVIDDLIETMLTNKTADMGTIVVPICKGSDEFHDSNVVKVVLDNDGFALYFSRAAIPFIRDNGYSCARLFKHWGIYAFRKPFLEEFVHWPPGELEQVERLEQLRALENGARISVCIAAGETAAVDTPGDIEKVESLLERLGN